MGNSENKNILKFHPANFHFPSLKLLFVILLIADIAYVWKVFHEVFHCLFILSILCIFSSRQISYCGEFVSLNWGGGINVDSRQAYEAIKTRLMPDWRWERDCICMLRRPGWPISTLSRSPSHMNTKPYNFLWRARRRCSPVAFAFKLQHSQAQAKMQTFWKLYQAKKCLAFILRRRSQRWQQQVWCFPLTCHLAASHWASLRISLLEKSRERNWVNLRDFCGVESPPRRLSGFRATVFCLGSRLLLKASGNKFFSSRKHIDWHRASVGLSGARGPVQLHRYYHGGYLNTAGLSSLFGDDDGRHIINVHNWQWNGRSNW